MRQLSRGRVKGVWGPQFEAVRGCGGWWCWCGEVLGEEGAKSSSAQAACGHEPWAAGYGVIGLLRFRACVLGWSSMRACGVLALSLGGLAAHHGARFTSPLEVFHMLMDMTFSELPLSEWERQFCVLENQAAFRDGFTRMRAPHAPQAIKHHTWTRRSRRRARSTSSAATIQATSRATMTTRARP